MGQASDVLMERCFAVGPAIRYVAVYRGGELQSRQREGLAHASAGDSDRYEELLVNPTLLTLTGQRGAIDCGGLRYVLVRYGNFFAFVHPLSGGHVAVALEPDTDPGPAAATLQQVIGQWVAEQPAA